MGKTVFGIFHNLLPLLDSLLFIVMEDKTVNHTSHNRTKNSSVAVTVAFNTFL